MTSSETMKGAATFAARQFAIAAIETTVEVIIGNLIALVVGVPFDNSQKDIARSLGTNFLSNLITAGLGNHPIWSVDQE